MITLDHPAYTGDVRLRGYNGRVAVMRAVNAIDAAKVLRRLNPDWTKQDHRALAAYHQNACQICDQEWNALLDVAAMQAFGRKFLFQDYRISGIANEEFSEPHKQQLRRLAHAATKHGVLSDAHREAARRARANH